MNRISTAAVNRIPVLTTPLAICALLLFSTAHIEVASAESDGILSELTGPSCQAKPNTHRDGVTGASLADIGALLAAAPVEEDVIPLNNQGYNYPSMQRPSNEILFMDAELQRQQGE